MQLYLLRHGIAEDARPGQPDAERVLTPEGRRKLRTVLKLARDAQTSPALIITSPYRRALASAELAAEILDYKGHLVRTEVLIPSSRPESVWDEIRLYKDEPQILLAGHDPLFTILTGYLLNCRNLQVDFKKGALVRIDVDRFSAEPRGILKWMISPKLAK